MVFVSTVAPMSINKRYILTALCVYIRVEPIFISAMRTFAVCSVIDVTFRRVIHIYISTLKTVK